MGIHLLRCIRKFQIIICYSITLSQYNKEHATTSPSGENDVTKKTLLYISLWIRRNRERILVAAIVFTVLYFIYLTNYAFFHTTVEGFVVVIASAIFLLARKSRQVIKNYYFLILGIFRNGGGPLSSQL